LSGDIVAKGAWQIDIAGERFAATASLKPLYDPDMKKIKC
jgi:4-methylaminobutanoate oxidase (formaldehyde-forming)